MVLIKPVEHVTKESSLSIPHRGVVDKNDDPKKIGRIKCTIPEIWDGIDVEKRPWIYPLFPPGLGGKSPGLSWFGVPVIGSELVVIFPFQDINFPFYIGFWPNPDNHNADFDEDYPDTYGWRDNDENYVKVNQKQGYIQIHHHSGTNVQIEDDGTVNIDIVKDRNENIDGDSNRDIDGDETVTVGGEINIDATGKVCINGSVIELNGSGGGVITEQSVCPFTRSPHMDGSTKVKAGK